MIVASYLVHLYCDNKKVEHRRERYGYGPYFAGMMEIVQHEFSGHSRAACMRDARTAGWTIRGGVALCPACKKAGYTVEEIS